MKNILRAIVIMVIATVSVNTEAAGDKQFMKDMKYTNPVPNYVSVIKKNAKALELTEDQMAKVNAWNKANGPRMAEMVYSVIQGEKEIKMASLNGKSYEEITKMADSLLETRKMIIVGKTKCRDYIMSVLTEAQWRKLTEMIKA